MTLNNLPAPLPDRHTPAISLRIGDFYIRGWLGGGRFSSVYLAEAVRSGRTYALKVAVGPAEADNHLEREAENFLSISHPNIVSFYEKITINGRPALILEPVYGKSLRAYMDSANMSLDESSRLIFRIASEILSPLLYLHQKDMIHGDLKPENIAITFDSEGNPGIKLLDLGLSGSATGKIAGTPLYMAPEAYEGRISPESDIWSFGIILYELIFKKTPFEIAYPFVLPDLEKLKSWREILYKCGFPPGVFEYPSSIWRKNCLTCLLYTDCNNLIRGRYMPEDYYICNIANRDGDIAAKLYRVLLGTLSKMVLVPDHTMRADALDIYDIFSMTGARTINESNYDICGKYAPQSLLSYRQDCMLLRVRDVENGEFFSMMIHRGADEEIRNVRLAHEQCSSPLIAHLISHSRQGGINYLKFEDVKGKNLRSLMRNYDVDFRLSVEVTMALLELLKSIPDQPDLSISLSPDAIIMESDTGAIKIADITGGRYSSCFYQPPLRKGKTALLWNIASVIYELNTGIVPVQALFPPRFFHNEYDELLKASHVYRKFEQMRAEGDGLPSGIFYSEEMVGCDRCRNLFWEKDDSMHLKGRLCKGDCCTKGDHKVLRFKLPIPLALLLKNRLFVFDEKSMLSPAEFAQKLAQMMKFDDEMMRMRVFIPGCTMFRLGLDPSDPDKALSPAFEESPGGDSIPPDFSWLPWTLAYLPHYLAEGYEALSLLTDSKHDERKRLRELYRWNEGGGRILDSFGGDVNALKTMLQNGHLALARQLSSRGYLKSAFLEYEKALELNEDNQEILEESIILCGMLNYPLKAKYYLRKLQRGGASRHMGALFTYIDGKSAKSGLSPGDERNLGSHYQ